jgi:hypothetical protein
MTESNQNDEVQSIDPDISRRDYLRLAGRTAIATLAAVALGSSQRQAEPIVQEVAEEQPIVHAPFSEYSSQPTELGLIPNSVFEFENQERSIDLPGMGWTPDGHVPFITTEDGKTKRMYISGINSGIQGSYPYLYSDNNLRPEVDAQNFIVPSITNDPNEVYRNGYSAVTSVVDFNGGHLGFTHNEQHGGSSWGFTASVGITFSKDQGKTFEPMGQLIAGRAHIEPGQEQNTGAGQPSAIKVKDQNGQEFIYVTYIEWLPKDIKPVYGAVDQLYLARMAISGNSLGALEHYTTEGFRPIQPEEPVSLKPVITPPRSVPGTNYAALPSISHDKNNKRFIAVYETDIGVFVSKSTDAMSWSEGEFVIKYPKPLSSVWSNPGTTGYSYPTLLDLSQNSDASTGSSVSMLLAKGIGSNSRHNMVAINGRLKS